MRASIPDRGTRKSHVLLLLVSCLAGLAIYLSGAGIGIERSLQSIRNSIRTQEASGKFVLVEIDAKSLRAIDEWPWPRSVHGRALRMLDRAGASTVTFDVDFSSKSSADEDMQFAAALGDVSVPVILPTFRQYASQNSTEEVENAPLPIFREHAQLAAVNIFPDSDGLVRTYPSAVVTGGVPRPSIGAILAGVPGRAGVSFPLDLAINPRSIPHISYSDVLAGEVSPGALTGRSVLIGATAIELGDRYPVPGWGVISGPAIQLLAAETLQQGSSPISRGPWVLMGITLFLLLVTCRVTRRKQAIMLATNAAVILVLPLLLEWLHWGTVEAVPALVMLTVGGAWLGAANAVASFNHVRGTEQVSGLPNRRTLENDLAVAVAVDGRMLVVGRICGYGDFASLLGPVRGAELVMRIVDRLQSCGIGTVYRIEDNLIAFLVPKDSDEEPKQFFGQIVGVLRAPVEIAARKVQLDYAFGRATLEKTPPALAVDHGILAVDLALERGKVWDDHSLELEGTRDWQLSLTGELDDAMAAGNIWVAYQPKLHLDSRQIVAAEALVRWSHPERGEIYPDSFIPQLESNGRILDLTLHVLDDAMRAALRWRLQGRPINVAVNISAPLLTRPELLMAVQERLANGLLFPELLTFEVTESARVEDLDGALACMERLAEMGMRLSIDDYGTGRSTLSYLKHLPAKEIKIDKSFVLGVENSRSDQTMVLSTIALAHELGLQVVAEGVENETVLGMLHEYGCDYAQGWHIGRPVTEIEFAKLIGAALAA